MQRTQKMAPAKTKANLIIPEKDLQHVVPGAYLIRAGSLTVDQVRDELKSSGMIFVRRFLAHAEHSDYLALFDPKVLAKCAEVETGNSETSLIDEKREDAAFVRTAPRGETPEGSWAALAVAAAAAPHTSRIVPAVVVAEHEKKVKDESLTSREKAIIEADSAAAGDLFRSEPTVGDCEETCDLASAVTCKKKIRPGRSTRQMLKALLAESEQADPEIRPAVPTPVVRSIPGPAIITVPQRLEVPEIVVQIPSEELLLQPPPSQPSVPIEKKLPLGASLIVIGSETLFEFRLRPFRVGTTMESDQGSNHGPSSGLVIVPHLTVYLEPRQAPGRSVAGDQKSASDSVTLAHVEKCHTWVKRVINAMAVSGALPDPRSCRVMPTHSDASRLARANVVSLQCRFRPDVEMSIRNAVYAVLRSAVWGHSLVEDGATHSPDSYLVRCWWRQVPASAVRADI